MMQREGFEASRGCQIARVSRAGFYRHYEEHEPRQADLALRDLIKRSRWRIAFTDTAG